MSDGVIFGIGGVLFIATTWATIAFLLSRLNELHRREVLDSPTVARIESDTFTDVYVTSDLPSQRPGPEGVDEPGGDASHLG
jgi:hypothetical protein